MVENIVAAVLVLAFVAAALLSAMGIGLLIARGLTRRNRYELPDDLLVAQKREAWGPHR